MSEPLSLSRASSMNRQPSGPGASLPDAENLPTMDYIQPKQDEEGARHVKQEQGMDRHDGEGHSQAAPHQERGEWPPQQRVKQEQLPKGHNADSRIEHYLGKIQVRLKVMTIWLIQWISNSTVIVHRHASLVHQRPTKILSHSWTLVDLQKMCCHRWLSFSETKRIL